MNLTTERLTLRPMVPGDAPALFEILRDAEAMRFWHRPAVTRLAVVEDMVREQIAAAGLTLEVSGLDRKLSLPGDPAKLRQIFLNLLSNAMKFTAAGGKVWLDARMTPQGVAVTVGDSGIGMNAEDIDVAMQPFGQVDNRLERRYEGTGLGLPLTRALVELHGGAMTFDSARDQGTRVTVVFPATGAIELAAAG